MGSEDAWREIFTTEFPNETLYEPTIDSIIPSVFEVPSGSSIKSSAITQNCLVARKFCAENHSCANILDIVPRVCGLVSVSCSTVTVTKCQAALRTLQSYDYFSPICLCKPRGEDVECDEFRDFLLDHPCNFVLTKEKDPYPVEALPTCNHALAVCQEDKHCDKLFNEFKLHCKVRDNKCKMTDKNLCHDAYINLRFSPMFGCMCPMNHMKKRCDKIYTMVNYNPCIVHTFGVEDFANHIGSVGDIMTFMELPLNTPVNRYFPNYHQHIKHVNNIPFNFSIYSVSEPAVLQVSVDTGNNTESEQISQEPPPISDTEIMRIHFQSTCHTALTSCRLDSTCAEAVYPVLEHCDLNRCNTNSCMEALQSFYRGPYEDLSLDIAFCLCRKTSNRHDACMIAQDKLHPICAQRPSTTFSTHISNGMHHNAPPACDVIAKTCKKDVDCRHRLETYEQACAIDSVTKKCAGRTSSCRSAMLGILGTSLRTSCACQGPNKLNLYECNAWHALLWLNPCVVESQKDFHMKRLSELGLLTLTTKPTSTTLSTTIPTTRRTTEVSQTTKTSTTIMTTLRSIIHHTRRTPVNLKDVKKSTIYHIQRHTPTEIPYHESNYIQQPDTTKPETLRSIGNEVNGNVNKNEINNLSAEQFLISALTTTEMLELESTIGTIATTMEPTTLATTEPPRFCVAQKPPNADQLILEGTSRRLYTTIDEEGDCSELCICSDTLTLTCHAICILTNACKTALAYYNHASPAYQAFRGRCLCYSGRFICMRPAPGDYSLPGGVYLMLGYSSEDERLLGKHTNLFIQDSIRALQQYIIRHINSQTSCTLTLFNMTDENIIISARLPHDSKINPSELLRKEKAQCASIFETLAHHVNNRHSELVADRLLSILKMAEYLLVVPEVTNGASSSIIIGKTFLLLSVLINIFYPVVRWFHEVNLIKRTKQ